MLARVFSCAVIGLEGAIIEVEVDTSQGLPKILIVGLPDAAVQESRERVQSAIKNSGLYFPRKKLTINLAPASVRKEGPAYDLPIALGILIATEQVPAEAVSDALIIGELSLDGSVRHVRGVLAMAALAREQGIKRIFVPQPDAAEAALIPDIEVIPVASLASLQAHLTDNQIIKRQEPIQADELPLASYTDFSEIKGQEHVKRALEVAGAGGHNMMMVGPPGAGKTLLARALPGILPSMTIDEALDVTQIYSVADLLQEDVPLVRTRPFRAPHHTISNAGLVGGGNWPHPGEITLAHRGVLFLDELPEFGPRVLEVMRQPIEDKVVTISRAQGSLTFPANFMLVAAMNPCPCGFFGDDRKECSCSLNMVQRYQKRISGPLMDRIDIHLDVIRVPFQKLTSLDGGEPSHAVRGRVEAARALQARRFEGLGKSNILVNGDMGPAEVQRFCAIDEEGKALMRAAVHRNTHTEVRQMDLSARSYHRVLKLARTIADLAGEEALQTQYLAEALQYRPREQVPSRHLRRFSHLNWCRRLGMQ